MDLTEDLSLTGSVGTCPWTSDANYQDLQLYAGSPYETIYNDTVKLMKKFVKAWNETDKELLYGLDKPGLFSSYGYDVVYLLAHALTKYHNQYGTPKNITGYNHTILREILVQTQFTGLTGTVSLNSYGDRINVCK